MRGFLNEALAACEAADVRIDEEDVGDLKTLKEYLEKKQHPVTQRWIKEEVVSEAAPEEASGMPAPAWSAPAMTMPAGMPMMQPMHFGSGEGVKITLKNARITIDRIVLKGKEK